MYSTKTFCKLRCTLALCSLTLIPAGQTHAWNSPGAAHVVEGIATTENGQPLANASLFLLDLQPSQGPTARSIEEITVLTDAKGHFTWNVPADVNLVAEEHGNLPEFSALPIDSKTWKFFFVIRQYQMGNNDDYNRRELLRNATRKCTEHWLRTGPTPLLSVIAPDTGSVTTQVRDTNGYPLKHSAVQVVLRSPAVYNNNHDIVYTGKTDDAGYLSLRCYPEILRLQLIAPGIGFGSIGMFQLHAGSNIEPQSPSLAPFSRLTGSAEPNLRSPDAIVQLQDDGPGEHLWYQPTAHLDSQGHFVLADVITGEHRVILTNGKEESQASKITVMPGEKITDIVLRSKPAETKSNTPQEKFYIDQVFSVRGHVLDAEGNPVANADVYALWYPPSMSFQVAKVITAKSAADGSYRIFNLPNTYGKRRIALVAAHAGYPIAELFAEQTKNSDVHADLTLPLAHSDVTIHVLQDGNPCAGAQVNLSSQENINIIGRFGYHPVSKTSTPLEVAASLLLPTATTDANGDAHFHDLPPGLWNIMLMDTNGQKTLTASGTKWLIREILKNGPVQSGTIIVQAGKARNVTISVLEQPNEAKIHVLDPVGQMPYVSEVNLAYGPAVSTNDSGSNSNLDRDGNIPYQFGVPGLYRLTTRFRDVPSRTMPISIEPYFSGDTVVAVSPALPRTAPTTIHTEAHGPGSIRVRLTDTHGKLQRGTVVIGDGFHDAQYAATIDKNGKAVFPDMPSGNYRLQATFAQSPMMPTIGEAGSPFPSDKILSHVKMLVPQKIKLLSNQENVVTFQPTPVGYVRGKLTLAAVDSPKNYWVYAYSSELPCKYHYEPTTGEFLAGPFLPGKVFVEVRRLLHQSSEEYASYNSFPVTVTAGHVTHISPTPFIDQSRISSDAHLMQGQVVLSDGKTPAWGARVALVEPTSVGHVQTGRADALGRLNPHDCVFSPFTRTQSPPGSPTESVLVAWLPGANGAVIAPYIPGQEAHLTLPAPITVRGHVTIGGKSVLGQPSSFQIRAAYQGHGNLNDLLSIDATSEADGSFELAGLTPGTYQVQAARDGIWLSQTQTLVVGEATPSEMTLDIAPIGVPVALHILDKLGQPLVDQDIDVIRPEGPLTDAFWPKTFTTDSIGILRLEGLEAGPHAVRVGAAQFDFDVPEWKLGNADIDRTISTTIEKQSSTR